MRPNGHSTNSSSSNASYPYHERMSSESRSSRTHYEDFTATPSPKVMNEYARNSLEFDFDQPQSGRQRRIGADQVGIHLLVETAVGDSAGYDILSIEELEELKREESSLSRRIPGLRRELALETKYRDAAKGFNRLDQRDQRSRGSSGRSSNNEYMASVAKCDTLSGELYRLERRLSEIREQRLRHTAGILQMDYERRHEQEMNKANGYQDSDDWDSGFSLSRFPAGGLADTEDGIMDIPGGSDPHVDATLQDLWTVLNSHDELLGTRDIGMPEDEYSIEAFSEKVQTFCSRAAGLAYELDSEREARHVTEEAQKANRQQLIEQLQASKDKHQQTEEALREAQNEHVRIQTEFTMVKAELDSIQGSKAQRAAELEGQAKQQNETLQRELRELVTEHEALTQQGIEAEKEREKLENTIDHMRERMETVETKLNDERVHRMGRGSSASTPASAGGPNQSNRSSEDPTSLKVMRSEFKKMMRDARQEHFKTLKFEQEERRRLEAVIRSLKKDHGSGSPGALSPSTTQLSPAPLGRSQLSRNVSTAS